LDNIEELSRASGCLPQYIRKGIAIATFILGRCFERGYGVKKDPNQAVLMYKKVKKPD
jgi:TPR repeat protein